ncbi:MAG: Ig-like domain-containing protein [Verrucomicrobiota bacterium]
MSLNLCNGLGVLLFVAANSTCFSSRVLDFPRLNPDSPIFSQLYSDVQVGNDSATGTGFNEGFECINAAYAYLHPQSPHQNNPAYLARLLVLLEARISRWENGQDLRDISGTFGTSYAYMLLKHHSPEDITSQQQAEWDRGIDKMCAEILEDSLLFDDHILASLWLNGEIRLALGVYCGGVALGNVDYQTKAQEAIDLVMSQAVVGDGASHYVGFNNEVATYRDTTINSFVWWWTLTGSPEIKAALNKTIPYVPMSVEPSGFQEQSTGIPYKHQYNGLRGLRASLMTAYLYGDRYNYYFGSDVENRYSAEYSILDAVYYQPGLSPQTPPSDFIVYDRAIMGPRGRWDDWAFVANGRNPQTPEPDHLNEGYEGTMIGKNTFVGALALGAWDNNTSLKAALDSVCVEFKNKAGQAIDLARSFGDGGIYRFLAQDEQTETVTRNTFGTLSTVYRLSDRVSAPASPTWGSGTDWIGKQLWLLTEDRLVGLVQIENEVEDTVYGLNARFVLVGGRINILGQYHELVEVVPDEVYDYGELSLRIHNENFGGGTSTTYQGITNRNELNADDRTAVLRLHDAQDTQNDTQISYPAGTRRYALVECIRSGNSFASKVENLLPNDPNFAVIEVTELSRKFRLIQNLTAGPLVYTGDIESEGSTTATLHRSWSETVDLLLTNGAGQTTLPMNLQVPAYGHAVVVVSSESRDHDGNTLFYEDLFTEGDTILAFDQTLETQEDTQLAILLDGFTGQETPTFALTSFPANGTLAGVPPVLAYRSNVGFTGTDSFTFSVTNSEGINDEGTVMIEVEEKNEKSAWYPSGSDIDRTFSNMDQTGFTLVFHDESDDRGDVAAVTDFDTPITLDYFDNKTLTFSFSIKDITTTVGAANLLRVGFRNNDSGSTFDATIHFIFGYGAPGDRRDVRFAGKSNTSHFFTGGPTQDMRSIPEANPLFTGNSSEITLSLTYLSSNGDGTHDYEARIEWDGGSHTSTTITRNTDTWDSAYIQANNPLFQVAGDGFTISDTEIFVEAPSFFELAYDHWLESYGISSSSEGSNFDQDEASDLTEFLLGGNPVNPYHSAYGPLSISSSGSIVTVSFPQRRFSSELGFDYLLKSSTDLVTWETVLTVPATAPLTDGFELSSVLIPLSTNQKEFFRLEVDFSD